MASRTVAATRRGLSGRVEQRLRLRGWGFAVFGMLTLLLSSCAPGRSLPIAATGGPLHEPDSAWRQNLAMDPEALPKVIRGYAKERERDVKQVSGRSPVEPVSMLALSGGGQYGAFGAGVLSGWTASGTRPTFQVVTGVSTGALLATYAFLGSDYDENLRQAFTSVKRSDIFRIRVPLSWLWTDAVASSAPLEKMIASFIDESVLMAVAREHQNGRRLFVGSTNLDTGKLVIWDMGAIASSRRPDALTLYRRVLLASCSIPVLFPPVEIPVNVDGQPAIERHIDGGVTEGVFLHASLLPIDFDQGPLRPGELSGSHLYVICDGRLRNPPQVVKPALTKIAGRSIETLLETQKQSDLLRIYLLASFAGMKFQLISVPEDSDIQAKSTDFDPKTMCALYEAGFELAKKNKDWRNSPPGMGKDEQIVPRGGTNFQSQSQSPSESPTESPAHSPALRRETITSEPSPRQSPRRAAPAPARLEPRLEPVPDNFRVP